MSKLVPLCFAFLLVPTAVSAQQVFTQNVEVQPSVERGATTEPVAVAKPEIGDSAFSEGAKAKWIWGPDNNSKYILRKSIDLKNIKAARLRASTDNAGTVYINGKRAGGSGAWEEPMDADVTKLLVDGTNVIEADVENQGGVAAFVFKLVLKHADDSTTEVVSDESWTFGSKRDEATTTVVALRGTYGEGPWGQVFNNAAVAGRVPAGTFELLPGFQVEKLFTVPKDELGSWVCITFDNKGRLLASDQGDLGICRITLPPVNLKSEISNLKSDQSGKPKAESGNDKANPPKTENLKPQTDIVTVERLDFSKCEFKPTGAQGMLWAFDSLYFSINGGPGSGLYRARDKDGDDQFDECVKLKEFGGGGEHGPHALRLSPDGKRIFVICGNHTLPPFNPGEELTNKDYTSRVPTNWAEDHLLPRMWDANGHAVGILAPGGWIASTDPDGKTWDIFSIGYRNPYDMAFNADGELFAYDADMEWDVGMPWYRPTRVVHATSGSEFGWRSGSGKWPTYYIDSLPPMINIGPGSPVGVDFGYGLKFPAKYQKALYICDWTFGTMYAIHIEPHMSTYKATKEEFVSRTPLPLTDVAAGPDGALYFSIGGRGTQSELFRVTYVGKEATAPTVLNDEAFAGNRKSRLQLENNLGRAGSVEPNLPSVSSDDLLESLDVAAKSGDRHLRAAVRNAFYNSDLFVDGFSLSSMQETSKTQPDPGKTIDESEIELQIAGMISIAKAPLTHFRDLRGSEDGQQKWRKAAHVLVMQTARTIDFKKLDRTQKLNYLRAVALAALRLGEFEPDDIAFFVAQFDSAFPTTDDDLNRELCQMLVYLKSPTVIGKTVKLLEAPSKPTVTDDMKDLLARNRGYGGAIAASIEKAPDQQQIWYAFCLRNMKEGWTMDQRKAYFAWFERAHQWAGGASYHGFLRNIEKEAFENASEKERLLIEASGARKPYAPPEIPKPAGPGKDWTLDEVRALAKDGLKGRNFENGQKMFAATRCIICHRFGGDGGATGPDLTQLAGRFNLNDLTEAIMVPSKVISDQYKASTIVTTGGQTFSGRIVAENDDKITILTSPEDPTKITEIPKSEVDEIQPSIVSIMPMDLLKPLNQDEVMDLLAYLLSRGDKGNEMFRK